MTRIMFIVLALLFLVACGGKSSTLLTQDFQRTVLERPWEPSNPGRDSIEGTFYGSNHAEVGGTLSVINYTGPLEPLKNDAPSLYCGVCHKMVSVEISDTLHPEIISCTKEDGHEIRVYVSITKGNEICQTDNRQ